MNYHFKNIHFVLWITSLLVITIALQSSFAQQDEVNNSTTTHPSACPTILESFTCSKPDYSTHQDVTIGQFYAMQTVRVTTLYKAISDLGCDDFNCANVNSEPMLKAKNEMVAQVLDINSSMSNGEYYGVLIKLNQLNETVYGTNGKNTALTSTGQQKIGALIYDVTKATLRDIAPPGDSAPNTAPDKYGPEITVYTLGFITILIATLIIIAIVVPITYRFARRQAKATSERYQDEKLEK